MPYAETLVKELLVFRGFTQTLRAFDAELSADKTYGFQVDRIVDQFLLTHVPNYEAQNLLSLFSFLKARIFSRVDAKFETTIRHVESCLYKYYVTHAIQKGRMDKVLEFFQLYGHALAGTQENDWLAWFGTDFTRLHATIPPPF